MQRREFTAGVLASAGLWLCAGSANALSESEAATGIRVALEKGAVAAVQLLGRTDGFLRNDKVRIPLPGYLNDAARFLRAAGQQRRIDELETAMNRAAEAAVPEAKSLLVTAVKSMSVEDARQILTGGEDAATQFFARKTREPLAVRFLPIVTRATQKVALADKYNAVAGRAAALGLIREQDANVQQYVTGKALDGLFVVIAEEERKIRQDPVGTGSAILKRVFGAIR
ncbi:DUF4197 domain-containing protein [Piscinibacter sp. XHJ-5]|uniref:DUF4197 domain-containing protein n=1 Tax=Piscinibacter sp. XHJ-5 TaxID=3037797 RepID=UPI002452999E|nr:DUF4197 domain-containing protein [Piscinibacter sp. XHJ-5]